jgi:excisionase family DNA binding protein
VKLSSKSPGNREFLRREEALNYLGVGATLLNKKTVSGEIPSYKIGGKRWYDKEDLDRWIENTRYSDEVDE